MLTLPPGVRVFVATERIDGRKGIDGLAFGSDSAKKSASF